MDEQSVML